ncbi:glycosyltransferase family 32 protein [Ceratobasidium sp. AG-Ba]|nr:glycosyltransferase family 32 protein [Ceratobasidium sp. AG-Ba]
MCLVASTTTVFCLGEQMAMPELPTPSTYDIRRPSLRWPRRIAKSRSVIILVVILGLYILHLLFDDTHYNDLSSWAELNDLLSSETDVTLSAEPLTPLGLEADRSFHLGSTSKARYKAELEHFVTRAFPKRLRKRAHASIELYLGQSTDLTTLPQITHRIYQIAKKEPYWTDQRFRSWRDIPGYSYYFFDDSKADKWIRNTFGGTEIEIVWEKLGAGIKRADLLRYLLVMVDGGIYSDFDTIRLKPISRWGQDAEFNGPELSNPPSLVVGIEADAGYRKDWHKFWPRVIQICQWTFGAAPLHPVLIDAVRRVHHTTAMVAISSVTNVTNKAEGKQTGGEALNETEPVSVMEWTGPGVFTDAVVRYLAAKHNLTWPALKGLRRPLRIGDMTVLPVTGFSPGVGMFGAGETTDREAMVHHMFAGSWKKSV